jgi:tRNA guanosine-2'-O-methyltransferase
MLNFLFHSVSFYPQSLQDAREDLRCSMAKDVVTIRSETLKFNGDNCMEKLSGGSEATLFKDMSSDFQKKITFTKHDAGDNDAGLGCDDDETYRKMAGMF